MYNTFLNSINQQSDHMHARDIEGASMQNYLLSKESVDLAQFNLRYPVGFEVVDRGDGRCMFIYFCCFSIIPTLRIVEKSSMDESIFDNMALNAKRRFNKKLNLFPSVHLVYSYIFFIILSYLLSGCITNIKSW